MKVMLKFLPVFQYDEASYIFLPQWHLEIKLSYKMCDNHGTVHLNGRDHLLVLQYLFEVQRKLKVLMN
jgi:hypothetical protein